MSKRHRYVKKADQFVVAVRLDLDTDGFIYRKWDAEQRCKRGDWLVDNDGDVYTIDAEVFANTYRRVDPGKYVKTKAIWAEVATESGRVMTKEGSSAYQAGDFLVSNNEDGTDAYCISRDKFELMYELDD